MIEKDQEYFEYLQECFDQLIGEYNYSQDEIKKLKDYIESLVTLCRDNYIEVPPIDEPVSF